MIPSRINAQKHLTLCSVRMDLCSEFCSDGNQLEQRTGAAKLRRFDVDRIATLLTNPSTRGFLRPVVDEAVDAKD